jgi:hypothetical protein
VASFFHAIRIARAAVFAAAALFFFAPRFAAVTHSDEPPADTVGVIEGEAIRVTGPMSGQVVHGQSEPVLRSGSDVRVKSGTARIDLVEGGQITICGPAHLSVIKSGGSLTVALDSGTIHARIEHAPALTIYTPEVQVQPVAIADDPQDVFVGFETFGAMCIHAKHGALRIKQQLTGQSVLIPQAREVLLLNGQLESLYTSAGHCACKMQISKLAQPSQPEISQLATAKEVRKKTFEAKPSLPTIPAAKPEVKEEPIYQVLPPLVYHANSKVQPEIDPQSVADATRRALEQREAAAKSAKVITNDGVKSATPAGSGSARAQAAAWPASVATGAPAAAGSAATPGPRDERSSEEVAALKEQIKQLQDDLDLLKREQALQKDTYYSNPDYKHDTEGKSKLDGMKQQIGDKQQEFDRLKARLAELGAARTIPPPRRLEYRPCYEACFADELRTD